MARLPFLTDLTERFLCGNYTELNQVAWLPMVVGIHLNSSNWDLKSIYKDGQAAKYVVNKFLRVGLKWPGCQKITLSWLFIVAKNRDIYELTEKKETQWLNNGLAAIISHDTSALFISFFKGLHGLAAINVSFYNYHLTLYGLTAKKQGFNVD